MSGPPNVPSATVQPVLLSITETARLLGVGRSTLYGLLNHGDLLGLKIGTRTLIKRTDVEALLERLPRHYAPQSSVGQSWD